MGRAVQLVAANLVPTVPVDAVRLGRAHVAQMWELIDRTKPWPWRRRTVELGTYLGVRHRGRLVAMAGERVRPSGWTEVSAVCTDAEFRGRGLASGLVQAVVHGIRARDEEAFLHPALGNVGAIRLYQNLGFRIRRETSLTVLLTPDP